MIDNVSRDKLNMMREGWYYEGSQEGRGGSYSLLVVNYSAYLLGSAIEVFVIEDVQIFLFS